MTTKPQFGRLRGGRTRPRTVRTREQSWGILLLTAVVTVFIAALASSSGSPAIATAAFWLAAVLCAMGGFRCARCGVSFNTDGLVLRNPTRTEHVQWDQVDRFDVDGRFLDSRVGVAHLSDGRRVRLWGLQSPTITSRPKSRRLDADVARLNAQLSTHRDTASSEGPRPAAG